MQFRIVASLDALARQQKNVVVDWLACLICNLEVSGLKLTPLPFTKTGNFGTFRQSVKAHFSVVC
jgi:hypothetical protein